MFTRPRDVAYGSAGTRIWGRDGESASTWAPRDGFQGVQVYVIVGPRFAARLRMANRLIGTEFHFGGNLLFDDAVAIILQCLGLHLLDA
jgi:hypothetical protein